MEENWSFSNLVESLQTVRKELEVLRSEHEISITDVGSTGEKGEEEGEHEEDDKENTETFLLQESKEAVLAGSLNKLNGGIQESEILLALVQYISALEGDKCKLKAQVRRLADENNWLRQELQRTQQNLQTTESEVCKLNEEKQHLEYTVTLYRADGITSGQVTTVETTQSDNKDTVRGSEATALEPGSDNQQQQHSSSSQAESYTKLHQLAVQHFRQGRHDVAFSLCKKAVQDIETKHGPINSDRGDLMNIMVVIYREQGKLKEAVDVLQEVLEIREKLNGRDHQTVAGTLNNLSVLKGKLGEYKIAESLCRRALEIRQKLLGNNHPDVAQQLVNLASLCEHLGKYEEVEWYYQRAIEIYQVEFGPDDENVIKTLKFLGQCFMKQGNLEAADKVFKRVRSCVQMEGGESREQSSSPTLLMRTDSPEKVSPPLKFPLTSRLQNESKLPRKTSEPNLPVINNSDGDSTTPKQKGRSSVSENVRKLFKWGGSNNEAAT